MKYYPAAQKPCEMLLGQAAADYESLLRRPPPVQAEEATGGRLSLQVEQRRTHLRLGHVRLLLADAQGALAAYQSAEKLFAALAAEHPQSAACRAELPNSRTNQRLVYLERGKVAEARKAYQRGQRWLEAKLPQHRELHRLQREAAELLAAPAP